MRYKGAIQGRSMGKGNFLCLLFCLISLTSIGQNINGYVQNTENEPIGYVNIFVKQIQSGTTSDENGYYFLSIDPGTYDIVISSIGYETQTLTVEIDGETEVNILMESSDYELNEVTIKASKKDPAYEIIQNAIENKKKFQSQISSLRAEVYVKANEEIDIQKKEKKKIMEVKANADPEDADPFEQAKKEKQAEMAKLNFMEMQMTLNYQFPNKYKEERTAYKVYGSKDGLYVPRFDEADFDFYDNLVSMRSITETPIVSPIARTAILSYKYKLIASVEENGQLVHKIKVIPRKSGNATVAGFIYINEDLWNINRLNLTLNKGSMKLFDELTIEVDYKEIEEGLWYATRKALNYFTKSGKRKSYEGKTVMTFSDVEVNYSFPDDFFGVEVSTITQEAYDRDSIYWNQSRPEKLSIKERELVIFKDSIETLFNSKEYKDSVQLAFNKVAFWEVIYEGLGFRNHEKKQQIFVSPLIGLLDFDVVGGFRFGPYISYSRRFENGRFLRTSNSFNIGQRNGDFNGWTNTRWRYAPFKQGDISLNMSRSFRPIFFNDAFLNQLRASNYILHTNVGVGHNIELLNGLFLFTGVDWSDRSDISDLDSGSFINELIDNGEPLSFTPYKTFITQLQLSYTPFQKYMREPNRKVILGSKWPTFSMRYNKGWDKILGSSVDYDYLEFSIEQDIILGVFGNSKYRLLTGQFVNTKSLPIVDIKRFRKSDPIIYTDPLYNFQVLDTNLVSAKPFFEFHLIHHFNGALVNNIPLIKKTKIAVVAGGGFLYVSEQNYRHQEIFAGIERVFKIGPRRRMRLGVYGVLGESNMTPLLADYKFSIDIIDTWKRDWSF